MSGHREEEVDKGASMSSTNNDPAREPDDGIEDDLYGDEGPPAASATRAPDWTVKVIRFDRSVFELHRGWREGRLIIQPEFQRDGEVWKTLQRVRLVESVLAKVPLPAFYVAEEHEERPSSSTASSA